MIDTKSVLIGLAVGAGAMFLYNRYATSATPSAFAIYPPWDRGLVPPSGYTVYPPWDRGLVPPSGYAYPYRPIL